MGQNFAEELAEVAIPAGSRLMAIPKKWLVGVCYSLVFVMPRVGIRGYWEKTCSALLNFEHETPSNVYGLHQGHLFATPTMVADLIQTTEAENWQGFLNAIHNLLFFNRFSQDLVSTPQRFFDPIDPAFVQKLKRFMRKSEAGQETLDIVQAHDVPVAVYKVPRPLERHVDRNGHYITAMPAIDLFIRESTLDLSARQRCKDALYRKVGGVYAHEQRHLWQCTDPVLFAMMKAIGKKTFLADLLISKIIEADAKAYQRRYEEQSEQDGVPRESAARRSGAMLESMPLGVSFIAALGDQSFYHDQTQCRKIRQQGRFTAEWNSLMTQIEDRNTPLGRLCWDFIIAIASLRPGMPSYLSVSFLDKKLIDTLRNVPAAEREPAKLQLAA